MTARALSRIATPVAMLAITLAACGAGDRTGASAGADAGVIVGVAVPGLAPGPAAAPAVVPVPVPVGDPGTAVDAEPVGKSGGPVPPLEGPVAPVHVALYGDSLAFEAQEQFVAAVTANGRAEVLARTFGGTAICDWLPDMRRDATEWQPRAVVVEFSGNALTPCMKDADGGALSPDAYLQKYRDDAAAVVAAFPGAEVWFAGSPISRRAAETGDFNGGRLNDLYRAQPGARFVDAGAAVLDAGRYTETLPCLADEPCRDDGSNVVRAPDGAHFCPANPDAVQGVTQGCAVWSSGAWRYARAMAAPVIADLGL